MARRFVIASISFIGMVFPAAFAFAFMAAPARPAPLGQPACERSLADTLTEVGRMQARAQAARGAEACPATRLYFLEVVKARAMTALCKTGADRERELVRLDADVDAINDAIAMRCN
jgi:hypothetical protein